MSSPQIALGPGRQTLSETAYMIIRDRILRGDIPLGTSLSRRELAAELGMSLIPVSEALQRLENEELVESRPRVGTRVCLPTAEAIRERYVIREALESQAARLFAEHANARDRLQLRRSADHMDAMFNRCSEGATNDREFLYAVQSYHLEFHLRIAEGTGCRTLVKTIEKNHVLIFNWVFDVAAHRPTLPKRFHRELADAISHGSIEDADRAMRTHIQFGLDNVVTNIQPGSKTGASRQRKR